jgi:tubulin--tyrosine ligase-like protein 12
MTDNDDYECFLRRHQYQLVLSRIPKHFYRCLYEKMKNEIFDSGSYFQLCPVSDDQDQDHEEEELQETYNSERRYYVSTLDNIVLDPHDDENAIFLIDHAWTYRIKDARNNLQQIPNLYERMASLMNIDAETKDEGIELILKYMWKYNQTYTMTTSQIDERNDREEAYEPYW